MRSACSLLLCLSSPSLQWGEFLLDQRDREREKARPARGKARAHRPPPPTLPPLRVYTTPARGRSSNLLHISLFVLLCRRARGERWRGWSVCAPPLFCCCWWRASGRVCGQASSETWRAGCWTSAHEGGDVRGSSQAGRRARVFCFFGWVRAGARSGGGGGVGGGVTGFTHSAFSAQGSAPHAPPAAARAQAPRPHALTHTGPPAPSAQRGPAPARPHARTRRPFFSSCFFRAADSKARLLSRSSSSSPAAPRHAAPRCPALQAPLLHDLPAAPRD